MKKNMTIAALVLAFASFVQASDALDLRSKSLSPRKQTTDLKTRVLHRAKTEENLAWKNKDRVAIQAVARKVSGFSLSASSALSVAEAARHYGFTQASVLAQPGRVIPGLKE